MATLASFDLQTILAQVDVSDLDHPALQGMLPGAVPALVKFRMHGLSEVAGYQIANHLGVRAPRHLGFWSSSAVRTQHGDAGPGRIGILVEHLAGFSPIGRDEAAVLDPDGVSRFLALCVFNRDEWGESGCARGAVYFVDLECVLPGVIPELLLSADVDVDYLPHCVGSYVRCSRAAVEEAVDEADRLGLTTTFIGHLRALALRLGEGAVKPLRFDRHPFGVVIENALEEALRARLAAALRLL